MGQGGWGLESFFQVSIRSILGTDGRHIQIKGPIVHIGIPINRRQRGLGLGVVRIETNRFLEEGDRPSQILRRPKLVVRPPLQERVMGLGVVGGVACLLRLFFTRQPDFQCLDDLLADLIL